jgi:GT2 family glycosyltransferase
MSAPIVGVLFRNNEDLVDPFFFFLRNSFVGEQLRLFVIDDSSIDRTPKLIAKNLRQGDLVFTNKENLGISKSRNAIINSAKDLFGEFPNIFFLDSDVFVIQKGSLETICQAAQDNPVSRIFYGHNINFSDGLPGPYGMCFCYLRKEIFEMIGLFDEQFFWFYDDVDFVLRTGSLPCMNCESAKAVHFWGTTTSLGVSNEQRFEIRERDRKLFEAKWHHLYEHQT